MEKIKLSSGITLIYERVPGDITSFTIGFEAGANAEGEENLGIAHATEHMVFKGTKNRSEKEINDLCNEYLGFHNAMTNFPYVVYYGSCLKEDFKQGFNVYFDIVFNPIFKEEGFKEEMSVILEELKEWSDDVVQHCEDMLFFNAFEERRIKNLIIGKEETIKALTLKDIKEFYEAYYTLEKCVISVVTALDKTEVIKIIEEEISRSQGDKRNKATQIQGDNKRKFEHTLKKEENTIEELSNERLKNQLPLYENPKAGIFKEENPTINGCKVQYIFPIHELSEKEIAIMQMFNEYFASGTSSILYDEIRTKRGLVYDIQGKVKSEKGIKLYTITLSTSKENLQTVQEIIQNKIDEIKVSEEIFNEEFFKKFSKSQKRKRMLALEKSIVMSMYLAVYEIMHSGAELLLNEFSGVEGVDKDTLKLLLDKVFCCGAVGIINN